MEILEPLVQALETLDLLIRGFRLSDLILVDAFLGVNMLRTFVLLLAWSGGVSAFVPNGPSVGWTGSRCKIVVYSTSPSVGGSGYDPG
jgi:hypothetical protein